MKRLSATQSDRHRTEARGSPRSGFWARMKETTACAVTIFALATASGCYKKCEVREDAGQRPTDTVDSDVPYEMPDSAGSSESGIPVSPPDSSMPRDSGVSDAPIETDTGVDTDPETDADTEVVVLGTLENLIGDQLNRTLLDREPNSEENPASYYSMGGPDTNENANPFTDGNGHSIGPSEEYLYKFDETSALALAEFYFDDNTNGNSYSESQAIWINGNNHFDKGPDDVVGELNFMAYTLKFDGPGADGAGIPVCTSDSQGDYAYCKDGDIDSATELHRVQVSFLGQSWIISEMNPPDVSLSSENQVVNGGSIKLAQESSYGILNEGESLEVDGLRFRLDNLEVHGAVVSAIFSIIDQDGITIKKDKVDPNQTKEFNISGKLYPLHVYNLAPSYTSDAKWAAISIFSKEIELEDGQNVNQNVGDNDYFQVALGWKNIDASAASDRPDALRTVAIFTYDINDILTSGDDILYPGDFVPILQEPAAWELAYAGLNLNRGDRVALAFEIMRDDMLISAGKGPLIKGSQAACTIAAPYISVSSDSTRPFSVPADSGYLSDNAFVIVLNSSSGCDTDGNGTYETALSRGTILMRLSQATNTYGIVQYATNGISVEFMPIGSGFNGVNGLNVVNEGDISAGFINGGVIHIENRSDVERGAATGAGDGRIGDLIERYCDGCSVCSTAMCADSYIAIAERAGDGPSTSFVNYWLIGVADASSASGATFDFDSGASQFVLTSSDSKLVYVPAIDPERPWSEDVLTVEEGYISERGSVFESVDDDKVVFSTASKVVKAVWQLISTKK